MGDLFGIRHIRMIVELFRYGRTIVLWEPQKPPNHFGRLREILRIGRPLKNRSSEDEC